MAISRTFARGLPLLLMLYSGCSHERRSADPAPHDPDAARGALRAALDAWKVGDIKSLLRRPEPIRFADDDQKAGAKLADYRIEDPDRAIAPHEGVGVVLTLRDRNGRAVERHATYQIGTDPGLSVLRSDE